MSESFPIATMVDGAIEITAFGRNWRLQQAANLEELWEAMGEGAFQEDERVPYWTELWPASLALAQWLYIKQADIKDAVCLDLGCGLGFTAMIGEWLGANVLACDYELPALVNAKANTAQNGTLQPEWLAMDWRKPAFSAGSLARIWAGDIMYEKRTIFPVLAFMKYCLAPGGKVWIAEPGRAIFNDFLDLARKEGWVVSKVFSRQMRHWYPQEASIAVSIWEAQR